MPKIYGVGGNGRKNKTAAITLKKEVMIRADLNIDDEVEVYVNSRKEICIKKKNK